MNRWSYPSSRLRVFNYLPYLDGKYEYDILTFGSEWVYKKVVKLSSKVRNSFLAKVIYRIIGNILRRINDLHKILSYLNILFKRRHYDLVFVQKVPLPQCVVRFIRNNKADHLIFDFDDAVFLDRDNRNVKRYNYLLKTVDAVITISGYNKNYAQKINKKVYILPTPVNTERYKPRYRPEQQEKVVIGWVGTPSTTRYLKKIVPVLEENSQTHRISCHFIGAVPFRNTLRDVSFLPWEYNTEVQYMHEFDIGIMPLTNEDAVLGKAGYKLLQYMAIGIPIVASPYGINKQLIKNGENGFLAYSEKDWVEKLSLLIDNPELRKETGLKGRDFVVKNYSLEVAAPKLISILLNLVKVKKNVFEQKPL